MSNAPAPSPAPRAARWLFIAYAALIIVLTHWPRLELPVGQIPRPDILVHVGVFGLWTLLCTRAGWFGPPTSPRNIALAAILSIAYAAFDESTQALPFVQRDCGWDDFSANLLGVGMGFAAGALLAAIDEPGADDTRSHAGHGDR